MRTARPLAGKKKFRVFRLLSEAKRLFYVLPCFLHLCRFFDRLGVTFVTMKKESFPLEVKAGSVCVKIYNVSTPKRQRWTLAYHDAGGRKLRQFADLADARREAKTVAETLNAGRGAALELSGVDRDAYVAAVRQLKPLDVPLNVAIAEYVKAREYNVPIVEAVKTYAESRNFKLPDKTVGEIVLEFLAAKKADGCSVRYQQDSRARLTRFSRDFQTNLKDVRTAELDAWLRGLKLSATSRNNFRRVICAMFSFARDAGYLIKGRETEAHATAKAKESELEIEVFTPEEYARLLAAADEQLLPFLVFGGMAGMRSAEIQRLHWQNVNWPESVIEIRGAVAKTGTRRLAPLVPAAAKWLKAYKNKRGAVIGKFDFYRQVEKLAETVGIPWKPNALRHGFCSYRMATLKNAPQVAYEAGNSVRMIQKHYDKVVTESQGVAWFSIMPEAAANVLPMVAEGVA